MFFRTSPKDVDDRILDLCEKNHILNFALVSRRFRAVAKSYYESKKKLIALQTSYPFVGRNPASFLNLVTSFKDFVDSITKQAKSMSTNTKELGALWLRTKIDPRCANFLARSHIKLDPLKPALSLSLVVRTKLTFWLNDVVQEFVDGNFEKDDQLVKDDIDMKLLCSAIHYLDLCVHFANDFDLVLDTRNYQLIAASAFYLAVKKELPDHQITMDYLVVQCGQAYTVQEVTAMITLMTQMLTNYSCVNRIVNKVLNDSFPYLESPFGIARELCIKLGCPTDLKNLVETYAEAYCFLLNTLCVDPHKLVLATIIPYFKLDEQPTLLMSHSNTSLEQLESLKSVINLIKDYLEIERSVIDLELSDWPSSLLQQLTDNDNRFCGSFNKRCLEEHAVEANDLSAKLLSM